MCSLRGGSKGRGRNCLGVVGGGIVWLILSGRGGIV